MLTTFLHSTTSIFQHIIDCMIPYYEVSFNLNGAPGTPPPAQTVGHGDYAAKPSPDPGWTSYIFGGWHYWPNGSGNPINFSTEPITSNKTFYAKWTSATNISFCFDFIIKNHSSYSLSSVELLMRGKVGGSASFTYFIDYVGSSIGAGSSTSLTSGFIKTLAPSTSISDIVVDFYATNNMQNVRVEAEILPNFTTVSYKLGNGYCTINYPYGSSTTPTSGSCLITIRVYDN